MGGIFRRRGTVAPGALTLGIEPNLWRHSVTEAAFVVKVFRLRIINSAESALARQFVCRHSRSVIATRLRLHVSKPGLLYRINQPLTLFQAVRRRNSADYVLAGIEHIDAVIDVLWGGRKHRHCVHVRIV